MLLRQRQMNQKLKGLSQKLPTSLTQSEGEKRAKMPSKCKIMAIRSTKFKERMKMSLKYPTIMRRS